MEISSLFGLSGDVLKDFVFWGIAALAGIVGVVAVVNALDMFYEAEAG